MIFHRHKWEEKSTTVVEPLVSKAVGEISMTESLFRKLISDTTTYVLRCKDCGDLKTIESMGVIEQ